MDETIAELKSLNEPVSKPLRLPTEHDIEKVEKELGINFHPDYERYLLEASDVVYGTLEPATISEDSGHTYIVPLAREAWALGVPRDLVPIAEDNGDYYCMNNKGQVLFWSHNGPTSEKWPSLAVWIKEVWICGR